MNRIRNYLNDLLSEIGLSESFIAVGEESFYNNEHTQYAVMMVYVRNGEIVKRLPHSLLETHPEVEWRDLKGFRDVVLHRYDEVSPKRVWQATLKLPTLRAAVEAFIVDFPTTDNN